MKIMDYVDGEGIKRQVALPDLSFEPTEGIPISLDVDSLFEHMPLSFRAQLVEELWNRDLIQPADFLKPGAAEKIRSAILSVAHFDTMDIITLAKERLNNGKR